MTISGRGRGRVTRWSLAYRLKKRGYVFAGCVCADGRRLVFTGNELKGGIPYDQVREMRP